VNVAPDPELVRVTVCEAGREPPRTWVKLTVLGEAETVLVGRTTRLTGMVNGARRLGGGANRRSVWAGLMVIAPV
jgi:hypothetical protein